MSVWNNVLSRSQRQHKNSDSIFIACFWSFTISSFFYGFLSLCIRAQSVALVLHDKACILCTFLCAPGFAVLHMDYVISDLEP